jgi:hypothetical protein
MRAIYCICHVSVRVGNVCLYSLGHAVLQLVGAFGLISYTLSNALLQPSERLHTIGRSN